MRSLITAGALAGMMLLGAPAQAQRGGAERLEEADTNRDGRITRAEFVAHRAARFDKMDRNHDGAISKSDLGRIARFRPDAAEKFDALIAAADGNGDGRVSREELNAAPVPRFDRADRNGDGVIDAAELRAAPSGGDGR